MPSSSDDPTPIGTRQRAEAHRRIIETEENLRKAEERVRILRKANGTAFRLILAHADGLPVESDLRQALGVLDDANLLTRPEDDIRRHAA